MKNRAIRSQIIFLVAAVILLAGCSTPLQENVEAGGFEPLSVRATSCDYGGEIKSVEALDEYTVRFTLCSADTALPAKLAAPIFAIQDKDYLDLNSGDSLKMSAAPNGTGPYVLKEWLPDNNATLVPSSTYWGVPPVSEKINILWQPDQSRRFNDYDMSLIEGMDFPAIVMTKPFTYLHYIYLNTDLKIVPHDPMNLYYIGFNNSISPFTDAKVRRAFSIALDREKLIDLSFPGGTELAQQLIPTGVTPGRSTEMRWYEYNQGEVEGLLTSAGYDFNKEITLAFIDAPMQTLYSPSALATEIKVQLEAVNIKVVLKPMAQEEFVKSISSGDEMLFIYWFMVDYMDANAFFEKPFIGQADYFGNPYTAIKEKIISARSVSDASVRQDMFDQLNQLVLDEVPLIPIGHSPNLTIFRATLRNIGSNVFYENLEDIISDKDIIRFVGSGVPASLWPADEDDFSTFRLTRLMYDTLLSPGFGGVQFEPLLAESWQSNDDLTEWTFQLRYNVQFSNGAIFDANDVVASFAAIWDASNTNHNGRTGEYAMFRRLFGKMLNE